MGAVGPLLDVIGAWLACFSHSFLSCAFVWREGEEKGVAAGWDSIIHSRQLDSHGHT